MHVPVNLRARTSESDSDDQTHDWRTYEGLDGLNIFVAGYAGGFDRYKWIL